MHIGCRFDNQLHEPFTDQTRIKVGEICVEMGRYSVLQVRDVSSQVRKPPVQDFIAHGGVAPA